MAEEFKKNLEVNLTALVGADTSKLEKSLKDVSDKVLTIKLDADSSTLFKDIQGDIRKIENAVNRMDFSTLGKNLAQELSQGAKTGVKKATASIDDYKQAMRKSLDSLNKKYGDQTDLFDVKNTDFNQIKSISELNKWNKHIQKSLSKLGVDSSVQDAYAAAWHSLSNVQSSQMVTDLKQVETQTESTVSKLQELGRVSLDADVKAQIDSIVNSMRELTTAAKQMMQTLQQMSTSMVAPVAVYDAQLQDTESKLSSVSEQIAVENAQIREELKARERIYDNAADIVAEYNNKSNGKNSQAFKDLNYAVKHFGEDIIGEANNAKYQNGMNLLKQYIHMGGDVADFNLSNLNEDIALQVKASLDARTQEVKRLEEQQVLLEKQKNIQTEMRKVAQAKESQEGTVAESELHRIRDEYDHKLQEAEKRLRQEKQKDKKPSLSLDDMKKKATAAVQELEQSFNSWDQAGKIDQTARDTFDQLKDVQQILQSMDESADLSEAVGWYDELNTKCNTLSATLKELKSAFSSVISEQDAMTEANMMRGWVRDNDRLDNASYVKIKQLADKMEAIRTKSEKDALLSEYRAIKAQAKANGRTGKLKIAPVNTELAQQKKLVQKLSQEAEQFDLSRRVQNVLDSHQNWKSVGKGDNLDNLVSKIRTAKAELDKLMQNSMDDMSDDDIKKIANAYKQLDTALKATSGGLKDLQKSYGKVITEEHALTEANKMRNWLKENDRAAKDYGDAIETLARRMEKVRTSADEQDIKNKFKAETSRAATEGKTGKSWFTSIKNTFSHISEIFGSYQVADFVQDAGRKVVENIKTVDDALTSLRMATGVSKTDANELMDTYSQLGDELKAVGTDVATAATEFMKQGESVETANQLAHDTIVLSKIGGLNSEESTQYLTAALKGYKMQASEAMDIVDQISTVDLMSATDVGGLAEGMSKVANTADLAGIEMNKLLGYLASIGEVTQQDMASVGTALNTIFARMGNIKLGRLDDYKSETGEDLSNVETVLKGEGIDLRDEAGQFRNFGDVLDETADSWQSFSKVSQSAIAQAFAGTHQRNSFITLMENYDKAMEYAEAASESSGSAMEKFSVYQDSMTGKMEAFRNSFQQLSTTIASSDFLKGIIEAGTTAINVLDKLISSFGSLNTLLLGVSLFKGHKGSG